MYFVWMGVFLVVPGRGGVVKGALWLLAPVVTAGGFALGLAVSTRLLKLPMGSPVGVFLWPLAGCVVGAAAVYWYGPMLIVFGMFVLGTVSVVVRQALLGRQMKKGRTSANRRMQGSDGG